MNWILRFLLNSMREEAIDSSRICLIKKIIPPRSKTRRAERSEEATVRAAHFAKERDYF